MVSLFVGSLLNLDEPEEGINHLTCVFFRNGYIGGLDNVVGVSQYGIGLPLATNLWAHLEKDTMVP